jgi:kumamolisin
MTLLFSLSIPPDLQEELEKRVEKGEVVPLDELRRKYVPNSADITALQSWLKAQGFQDIQIAQDGTGIYASANVAQIERTLQVKMVRVTKDGLTYTAAQNAPSLPADVGNGVQAIIGLQPFRRAHKHSSKRSPKKLNRASVITDRGNRMSLSPNVENAPPYLVQEILRAYNADGLTVTGKGQTIAILIDTVPADADLTAFWKLNGVECTLDQIEKINVNEVPLPAPEGEETLDVEWASGIAPGAKIRIYASGSLEFVELDRALDRILGDLPDQPRMRQLSISLGLGETFLGGPNGEVATQHHKFLRLAAAGVNVFVSSGDAGSNPDESGHSSTGATQAEYEASDPSIIGWGAQR